MAGKHLVPIARHIRKAQNIGVKKALWRQLKLTKGFHTGFGTIEDFILRAKVFPKKENYHFFSKPFFIDLFGSDKPGEFATTENHVVKQPEICNRRTFVTVTATYNDRGLLVELDLGDWKREDITIKVEKNWLIVEGTKTDKIPEEEGLLVRHVIRRYEIPPGSAEKDLEVKQENKKLKIIVPNKKSPV